MYYTSGYDDGYLWLRFDGNSDLKHISRLGLGVFFNCSNASTSYNVQFIFNRQRPNEPNNLFEGT